MSDFTPERLAEMKVRAEGAHDSGCLLATNFRNAEVLSLIAAVEAAWAERDGPLSRRLASDEKDILNQLQAAEALSTRLQAELEGARQIIQFAVYCDDTAILHDAIGEDGSSQQSPAMKLALRRARAIIEKGAK